MRKIMLSASLAIAPLSAQAELSISSKPTQNVTCADGVCTATAQKAVLNVNDLATMLASGDATVATGSVAKDIDLKQALSWTSTSRLTLDAERSVIVARRLIVAGPGGLTIETNDGKTKGSFVVGQKGSVQLWSHTSKLTIDGHAYKLAYRLGQLSTHF